MSFIQRLVPLDLIKIDVNEFKSKAVLFLVRATHQKYMSHCNVSMDMFCIHIICNYLIPNDDFIPNILN